MLLSYNIYSVDLCVKFLCKSSIFLSDSAFVWWKLQWDVPGY